jgi:hypothetical protein
MLRKLECDVGHGGEVEVTKEGSWLTFRNELGNPELAGKGLGRLASLPRLLARA